MTSLIDDVMMVGKSEEGLIEVTVKSINMNDFIKEVIEDIKVFDNNNHPIEFDTDILNRYKAFKTNINQFAN